jgi:hypothetical protein
MNAPIVFFAYNRTWHTEQTLSALIANDLADESIIYFFIDGCKTNANQEQIEKHEQVIEIVSKYKSYFKESYVEISPQNKGLANSVIYGITKVINKYEKVIVLEDDIVTSTGFLQYMNDALQVYENEDKVAGISGFSYIDANVSTYFSRHGSCWGWGTWKRIWDATDFDVNLLLEKFNSKELIKSFNMDGVYPFHKMLCQQKQDLVDSWAIRFYASYFLKEQLFLYPSKSMILNIGTEGTHHHSKKKIDIQEKNFLLSKQRVDKQKIVEDKLNKQKIANLLRKNRFYFRFLLAFIFNKQIYRTLFLRLIY